MNFYIWRDNVVGSLLGLADVGYQELAWSGAIESSDGTPDEMLVTLMNDWAFPSFVTDNREHFNESQIERISSLLSAIDRYVKSEPDYTGDRARVFASDAWRDIVAGARELYIALCPEPIPA